MKLVIEYISAPVFFVITLNIKENTPGKLLGGFISRPSQIFEIIKNE